MTQNEFKMLVYILETNGVKKETKDSIIDNGSSISITTKTSYSCDDYQELLNDIKKVLL